MTDQPTVTAHYKQDNETVRTYSGVSRKRPDVEIRVDFVLHDHHAALAALDVAVANIRAQIQETK